MRRVTSAAVIGAALLLAGCASSSSPSSGSTGTSGAGASAPVTVRLGFLSNITHAPALIALKEGFFAKALGSAGTLKATAFSAGTEETTALLSGQLDAAYVGPNPAITAWQKDASIQIISGAATGGASIVVKKGITSAAQLKGKSLATPSLGNTQDVALRYWLKQHGVATNITGGGDAFIKPTKPNSAAVLQFKSGQIAGGSEPAPYDIQMVADGGTVLLSEPGVTTLLIVTKSFLSAHPDIVSDLLKAQVQANAFIKSNPAQAQSDANAELASYTGKPLKADLIAASFKEITFTNDPDAASLKTDASQAVELGLLKPVDNLDGIFNLDPLNKVLATAGESQVSS
ncbi:MAG TPA: ABC transporter substrate-binding protein [Streptosporangiaceae bacterium]|nr:ABC transporter substrate-binding protein [Streptosporangiaceae bacterium]